MPLLSSDPFFEEQSTLAHALHGGADFGECITTMARVPSGDTQAWRCEWTATAERVAAIGDACAARGHRASAAAAWLRAANYYRTAYLFLYGRPASPALQEAFDREMDTFARAAAALDDPLAADPKQFAPYEAFVRNDFRMHWSVVQRAFMVHDVDSFQAYVTVANGYDASGMLASIRCPVFVAHEENDALARTAADVYAGLTGPKTLQQFTVAEGAGDHTAMLARSLFLSRMFDWLDETVKQGR